MGEVPLTISLGEIEAGNSSSKMVLLSHECIPVYSFECLQVENNSGNGSQDYNTYNERKPRYSQMTYTPMIGAERL